MTKTKNSQIDNTDLWFSMLMAAIFPMLLGLVLAGAFPDWRWSHYPFHAMVESVGAFSALIIATLIVIQLRKDQLSPRYIMVACALIGMGLLDGFHAVLHSGVSFVWLHSAATLVGGILFATIWLPEAWLAEKKQLILLLATITFSLSVGLVSILFPDILPVMIVDGEFSLLAKVFNITGGIGFLVGTLYFIRNHWLVINNPLTEKESTKNIVFANHCLLFSIAGLLFETSSLWDAGWWWWHILRLLAYSVVLVYFFVLFKRGQEQLEASEERLRLINSRVPGIVYQFKIDANGKRTVPYVSPTIENYIGLSAETIMDDAEKWFALTHPDELPELEVSILKSMEEMSNWEWEGRFIRPDGDVCWLHGSSSPLNLKDGSTLWDGVFVDITASKIAKEALSEASALNNKIINESPIGIAMYDHTGQCVVANTAIAEMVGATHKQVLAQNYRNIDSWKKCGLLDVANRSIAQQHKERHEFNMVTTFGKHASHDCTFVPFKLHNEQHLLLMVDDVSDRKKTERLLKDSEERLMRFMNSATDGFVIFDEDFIFQEINETAQSKFRMNRDDVIGKHILDVYPSLENSGRYESYKKVIKSGEPFYAEDVTTTPESGSRTLIVKAFKVGTGMGMIISDITERKKAEADLRESENELDRIFNLSPDIVGYGTLEGHFTNINNALLSILGYTREEFLNTPFLDFVHPNDKTATAAALQNAQEGISKLLIENRYRCKDGEYKWISWSVVSDLDKNEFVAVGRDVTARVLAEKLLYDQAAIIDQIHDSVISSDLDGLITSWNKGSEKLLGYTREEILGQHVSVLYPEDEHEFLLNEIILPLQEKGEYETEVRMRRKSGEGFYAHLSLTMLYDDEGKASGMIGYAMDISERKRVEEALQDSQRYNRMLFEESSIGLALCHMDGELEDFNTAYARIIGRSVEETKALSYWDITPEKYADDEKRQLESLKETGCYGPYEKEYIHRDGHLVPVRLQGLLLKKAGEIFIWSSVEDITERKRTEVELDKYRYQLEELVEQRTQALLDAQDELVRKERLATLGQLTATVSHELRNPLGAMRPSIYMLKKYSDKNNEHINKALDVVDRNISRCDHIIDELLDFTRITVLDLVVTQLDEWLESVIDEQSIAEGIQVEKDFSLDGVELAVDTDRLRRAVINVIENACHAMLDDNHNVKDKENSRLSIRTLRDHNRIEIIITDTGEGIATALLTRIFEPLYSTKGFGVGLGMPTVKQIMQQHGGDINVESEEDKGTTVTLWLPYKTVII